MRGFVRAKNRPFADWGLGKVVEFTDRMGTISWFDSPLTEPRVHSIAIEHLNPVVLDKQTRVYWLDNKVGTWRVGRILDADDMRAEVRFSNRQDLFLPISSLEVRWDRPLEEPSDFLAEHMNESPAFAEARSRFSRSLIRQRGACSGMSGLISSIIDLEQHQYEVVKRVLQDPVQRYLLADEVGLGKTIEAGVLIRQHILDNPIDHSVVVIVPPALVVQWRRELRNRFLLGHVLDDTLHVKSMDSPIGELVDALHHAGMAVMDEAHHLSEELGLYEALRKPIIGVPCLLLLTATPVLHNERGFLEMMHLLDPHIFRLEDESAFRQRIKNRQALAESVAGLAPDNLLQIEHFLDDLGERFPSDKVLRNHSQTLRDIVQMLPDEDDPSYLDALRQLRAHVTETYRLDRRVLRNRRRDLSYLTPHRAGLKRINYSCAGEARLVQAVENWRSAAVNAIYGHEQNDYAHSLALWFRQLMDSAFTNVAQISSLVHDRVKGLREAAITADWEQSVLTELGYAAELCASNRDRLDTLADLMHRLIDNNAKIIVFCSESTVADTVTEALRHALSVPIERHAPHDDPEDDWAEQPWERFLSDPAHQVLVCDATGEEGLNLQGGRKTVIHYDLPLSPNRIEQRLGRVDRYGSGDAVRSFFFCCSDDPYSQAWSDYIDKGLKLFDRSVANLQYLIEDEMQAWTQALFLEGVDGLRNFTERTGGEHGTAERELRRIDDQDALDALTLPDEEDDFEALTDVDSDWGDIADSVQAWMIDILQVGEETAAAASTAAFGFGTFRFCFSYRNHASNTLIPFKRVVSSLLELIDPDAPGAHSRFLKTGWYSCRRGTVTSSAAAAKGTRLVRWGESLIDRVEQLTALDDRGRAAAMWRQHQDYTVSEGLPADLFVRFDFIVETNVRTALDTMEGDADPALQRALERRGDLALPPFYQTIWLDEGLSVVTDSNVLELLDASYRRESGDSRYRDWNLNPQRWPLVYALRISTINAWREWVVQAREAAEAQLRDETDLDELCVQAIWRAKTADEGRFAQLRARIQHTDPDTAAETRDLLVREEQIAEALYGAMREPRIILGTVVAVFLSSHSLPQCVERYG